MKIFDHLVVGPLQCNCYIVGDPETRSVIVIDPGDDADVIAESIARQGLTVTAIIATHAHFDHVVAAARLRELTGAPFHLHPGDEVLLGWVQESGRMFLGIELPAPPEIDVAVSEGDHVVAGSVSLDVIHTPGHSPGSISLLAGGDALFSGDTLFAGSIGRTDLPGGDTQALLDAVKQKLFALDLELPVYPGHGPATSLGAEQESNPFVGARGVWVPPE